MDKKKSFFRELLRRKVVRQVGGYIAIMWLLAQGFGTLFPYFGFPNWVLQAFVGLGIALIPVVGWLSWKYDLEPPRLVKDPEDAAAGNHLLGWAKRRHESHEAGFLLLKWQTSEGKQMEKRYFKPVTVGRADNNELQLRDDRVSRNHAVFWAEDGKWHVRDDSTNGTWLNHVKVAEPTALPQSCELQFHPQGPVVSVYIDHPAKTAIS